jgi:hypothetical protein
LSICAAICSGVLSASHNVSILFRDDQPGVARCVLGDQMLAPGQVRLGHTVSAIGMMNIACACESG